MSETVEFKVKCEGGPWNGEFTEVKGKLLPFRMNKGGALVSYEFIVETSQFVLNHATGTGTYTLNMEFGIGEDPKLYWKWKPYDASEA